MTWVGLGLSTMLAYLVGAGIASGIATTPAWSDAYDISSGAVLVAAFDGLGGFGKFCGVILALGVIANNVPGTYSAGLGFQCLGSWPEKVPRAFWNTFGVIVYTVCAAVGRDYLYDIFENFLALMGYWVTTWLTITLEEQLIFRRKTGYNWEDWNNKGALPIGLAALAAFIFGWVGAVISMDQIYFIGPIASLVGDYGADVSLNSLCYENQIVCLHNLVGYLCRCRLCRSHFPSVKIPREKVCWSLDWIEVMTSVRCFLALNLTKCEHIELFL